MKTATGVKGEEFTNFVQVVVYCKLFAFFLESGQLWIIQTTVKTCV